MGFFSAIFGGGEQRDTSGGNNHEFWTGGGDRYEGEYQDTRSEVLMEEAGWAQDAELDDTAGSPGLSANLLIVADGDGTYTVGDGEQWSGDNTSVVHGGNEGFLGWLLGI